MTVRVRLFAIIRDRAGISQFELELPEGSTVANAATAIGERFPEVAALLARAAFAVNQQYTPREMKLQGGDELAVIPPVSGG